MTSIIALIMEILILILIVEMLMLMVEMLMLMVKLLMLMVKMLMPILMIVKAILMLIALMLHVLGARPIQFTLISISFILARLDITGGKWRRILKILLLDTLQCFCRSMF
jgi:Eukaryotic protein of unknown function (DUF829)